jgi:hypothetical protein
MFHAQVAAQEVTMRTAQAVRPLVFAVAAVMLTASACAPLDQVMIPQGRDNVLVGEVRSLDARRGRLDVREERGRMMTVRLDNRTPVLSGSRRHPVSSLRRGDLVRIRVSYDRSGTPWAERIDVRHSTADRRVAARIERIDGRVTGIDNRRGYFTVDQGRRSTVVVYVPNRLSSGDARRFDRLRRGDRVRAEVMVTGRDRAELVRFR